MVYNSTSMGSRPVARMNEWYSSESKQSESRFKALRNGRSKKKKKALGNADFTQFDLVATLGLDEIVDIEDDVNFHFGNRGQLKNAGIPSLAEVSVPGTGGARIKVPKFLKLRGEGKKSKKRLELRCRTGVGLNDPN